MTLRILQSLPTATVASMRQDLDAGKRLELDFISGEIDRLGRKHGLATPLRHRIRQRLIGGEGFAVDASPIKADANQQKGIEGNKRLRPETSGRPIDESLPFLTMSHPVLRQRSR